MTIFKNIKHIILSQSGDSDSNHLSINSVFQVSLRILKNKMMNEIFLSGKIEESLNVDF